MLKYFVSAIVLIAGTASLLSPLFASGDCGVNPVLYVPSKCLPPHDVAPDAPNGGCLLEEDGGCFAISCNSLVWSNGIPGRCGNGIISENTVPRCLQSYAVTNVTIRQYATECMSDGTTCHCLLMATGVTDQVPVCNCKDLEPLH